MRIAVMGTGGVGGYFGAKLAADGAEVAFVARGAHLAAMRERGLLLTGARGDTRIEPVRASDDPASIGPVDVVLFTVKLYDTESAGRLILPMVGPETLVISLQNGVDAIDRLAPILGEERVLGGAAYVSGHITAPGVVTYTSDMSSIVYGARGRPNPEAAYRFRDLCRAAGFSAEVSDDIEATLWMKFVPLATNSALTALTRQPAGIVYRDPDLRALAIRAIDEVIAIARAKGVALPADARERALALADSFPPGMYASQYHDLANGRRLELEHLSGHLARVGAELGVEVPFHRFAYACLKPYRDGPVAVPD
jgi:2-dehydropantoate 2-reductase